METPLGIDIIHLGGEKSVTGSCHLLRANGLNIMVDCGLAQGNDDVLPMESWPVKPVDIDYLFLTHAHIDHIGRVPELIERGFLGEIICSHATKALLEPMLQDAMGFSNMGERQAEKILKTIDELSWGFEYREVFSLKKGIKFKLGCAGHILGSCWIQFDISDYMTVVFSGDLGAKDTPILCDPDVPEGCDLLILESTYGDRNHEGRGDRIKRLGEVLLRAIADGGKVFIPAFSLGRTQELIYEMDRLRQWSDPQITQIYADYEKQLKEKDELAAQKAEFNIPVFIDSPLGLEITTIYSRLSEYWDKEAKELKAKGDHPIDFKNLYSVERFRDHKRLLEMDGPAVIIAGSGMCTGGRIIEHLKAGIEDSRNDIFFVGYQAKGTAGRDILKYSKRPGGYVMLDGEKFDIKARVHTLSGYSAHADQNGLLEWVESMPEKPGRIKLVHGENRAQKALYKAIF
jgi:metallo-beta-lactamase family protein